MMSSPTQEITLGIGKYIGVRWYYCGRSCSETTRRSGNSCGCERQTHDAVSGFLWRRRQFRLYKLHIENYIHYIGTLVFVHIYIHTHLQRRKRQKLTTSAASLSADSLSSQTSAALAPPAPQPQTRVHDTRNRSARRMRELSL